MRLKARLSNTRGSVIPFILIIIPSILFVLFQLVSQSSVATKEQTRIRTLTTLTMVRSNLIAHLQDSAAWQKTIDDTAANATMNCLRNHSNCLTADEGFFQINNALGTAYYNSIASSSGFNASGTTCTNYGSVLPGNDCSLRVNLRWKADCTVPCVPTRVKITADFALTWPLGFSNVQLNTTPYYFEFYKNIP